MKVHRSNQRAIFFPHDHRTNICANLILPLVCLLDFGRKYAAWSVNHVEPSGTNLNTITTDGMGTLPQSILKERDIKKSACFLVWVDLDIGNWGLRHTKLPKGREPKQGNKNKTPRKQTQGMVQAAKTNAHVPDTPLASGGCLFDGANSDLFGYLKGHPKKHQPFKMVQLSFFQQDH